MRYINGKCYDSHGNEMSQSQINQMYKASQAYIQQLNESRNSKELSREELLNKFQNSNFKIKGIS